MEVQPKIEKSAGTTRTEQILAQLCESSFLKLWSYPNPYKDDGKELCDLLVGFDRHLFVFFDRENHQVNSSNNDLQLNWKRWKRQTINAQIRTAKGAERYLRARRPIFLDRKLQVIYPLVVPEDAIIRKIIVAHGAARACKAASQDNVYGSLAISYRASPIDADDEITPFFVGPPKDDPIHIFDSHNLEIVLTKVDTMSDFSAYLDAKCNAIKK